MQSWPYDGRNGERRGEEGNAGADATPHRDLGKSGLDFGIGDSLARVNRPPHCPVVKTLKLVIYLLFDFWFQIWSQKYHISPWDTQFLFNKHKIGASFSLHSLQWGQWGDQSSPSGLLTFKVWGWDGETGVNFRKKAFWLENERFWRKNKKLKLNILQF
jgi:hypothetical protein